jgi:tRNA(fMet)-specific endonuclease VapC
MICQTSQVNWHGKVTQPRLNVHSAMLGNRFLLDTNALVALLQGHQGILALTGQAQWLGVSVINVLEFLGFDGLSETDRQLFKKLVSRLEIVDLSYTNAALMEAVTNLRQIRALKLPDAIIMASAALHEATVITNDTALLKLSATEPKYAAQAF